MGFYGNITNTSRTQFQFDRIYSNRVEMDTNKFQDGIYAGRYVLIEYDQAANLQLDTFLRVYFNGDKAYTSSSSEANTIVTVGDMKKRENPYVYTADTNKNPSNGLTPTECVFYIWKEVAGQGDFDAAKFEHAIESSSNYTVNYNIDTKHYGEGRGYDSTVWQKMYIDNMEKYVMIAELNTVVPTFEVSADAPTMNPVTPHFDAGSTDVYYKLHYQPQWGFRVKEADESSNEVIYSDDTNVYPSDEEVNYKFATYDPKTGKGETEEVTYPAAIYYNKAGFEPAVRTHYDGEYKDEISILPTGYSGNKYNNHDGTNSVSEQVDIQELKILLPAIGNMVSDAWDIIYGYNKEDNKRYRDIDWKLVEETENFDIGGMTRDVHTFAGCINTIHDLIGMIVTKEKPEPTRDEYNKKYIYMTESDDGITYERILRQPTYTSVDVGEFISEYETFLNTPYPSTQEKNTAYENLFRNFQEENYYIKNEKNEYLFINIKALPDYIIAKNDEGIQWNGTELFTDGKADYQYIQIQGLEDHLLTILGSLIDCRNLLGTDTPATTDRTTVQGALNALNGIIDRFKSAVPGQFTFVDENGKLISMNWTTKQPFSWINYGDTAQNGVGSEIENRFIDLSFNFDEGLINLTHKYNKIEDNTTTESNKNLEEGTGNNAGIGNDLQLYTPIVDNAGHVIGHNIEIVTLPYGYKIIKASNTEDVTAPDIEIEEMGQIADNTQDIINFNASNRWIKIDNKTEDTIKFGHRLGEFAEGTSANVLYGLTQNEDHTSNLNEDNKFEVPCLSFDEAGHITEARTHTVTLPENYDKVEVEISPENFQNEKLIEGTAASLRPGTMTDTLTFKQGNKWVLLTGNADNDSIIFSHYVDKFSESDGGTTNFNNAEDKDFYIQEINWDEAGHLISSKKHNFILPDSFKNISITNSGSSNIAVDTSITNGILTADTLVDTATIDSGNRWIQLKADPNDDKVTIYHAPAGTAPSGNTTIIKVDNPDVHYGEAFKIPEVKYDEAGHISAVDTHEVKFPTPSINSNLDATSSSVLTGFKLTPETLAITQTNADVGTLKLTQYIQATGDTLNADDTINNAFRKLSTRIQAHEDDLNALIGGQLKEKFDTLVEMSKWLDENDTEIVDRINEINTNLTQAIENESIARQQSDNAINVNITNLTNEINTEISNRENAIKTVNNNLSAETTAREQADSTHSSGIQANANAIIGINNTLLNKFDGSTLFDWGYKEILNETRTDRVDFADGSYRIDTINTYTSVKQQVTLQSILDEICKELNLHPKTADRTETIEGEIIPAPEPEIPEEEPTT